ncbi:MAG: DUF3592 domain-containing protein [Acidobacteriota bacterium]
MEPISILIGLVQFLMGASFCSVSIFFAWRRISKEKNWMKTTGLVTNVETSRGMQQPIGTTRNTLFRPTVRFQTADGRIIDYQPTTSNNLNNYNVGEQIPIFYNPQSPEQVMFGSSTMTWVRFIVFGFVGGFLALFGVVFLLLGIFSKF